MVQQRSAEFSTKKWNPDPRPLLTPHLEKTAATIKEIYCWSPKETRNEADGSDQPADMFTKTVMIRNNTSNPYLNDYKWLQIWIRTRLCLFGGFQSMGLPQSSSMFRRIFHRPSIFGVPPFMEPPIWIQVGCGMHWDVVFRFEARYFQHPRWCCFGCCWRVWHCWGSCTSWRLVFLESGLFGAGGEKEQMSIFVFRFIYIYIYIKYI